MDEIEPVHDGHRQVHEQQQRRLGDHGWFGRIFFHEADELRAIAKPEEGARDTGLAKRPAKNEEVVVVVLGNQNGLFLHAASIHEFLDTGGR